MKSHKIIALVSVTAILLGCVHQLRTGDKTEYKQENYVVHSGDTLWDIAVDNCPEYMDKRLYIDFIQEDNDCDVILHPGENLKIRIYK